MASRPNLMPWPAGAGTDGGGQAPALRTWAIDAIRHPVRALVGAIEGVVRAQLGQHVVGEEAEAQDDEAVTPLAERLAQPRGVPAAVILLGAQVQRLDQHLAAVARGEAGRLGEDRAGR